MSNEVEYDPFEYAKELAAGEDLGRSDFEERRERSGGLTRGELLKRGAVGVGRGRQCRCDGRHRCGPDVGEREVHGDAARAFARGRVPDSGHRQAGLGGSSASP